MTQLNVAADMDKSNLLMAQVYRPALNSEALRREIFAGRRSPLVFGEPEPWVGWLIQSGQMAAQEQHKASQELRESAFEAAPATPGTIDGRPFEWIADADPRLGPTLEAIINGRYYWIPFGNVDSVFIEVPTDLRDLVWAPAQFKWTNGGESFGLIPTRYPDSEASEDSAIRLARKTEWIEQEGGVFFGVGQRMLATEEGEYPLLETRKIVLRGSEGEKPAQEAGGG